MSYNGFLLFRGHTLKRCHCVYASNLITISISDKALPSYHKQWSMLDWATIKGLEFSQFPFLPAKVCKRILYFSKGLVALMSDHSFTTEMSGLQFRKLHSVCYIRAGCTLLAFSTDLDPVEQNLRLVFNRWLNIGATPQSLSLWRSDSAFMLKKAFETFCEY